MQDEIVKFEETRITNPQGTIDALLAQSKNQAQTIHRLTEQNEGLLSIEDLDEILTNLAHLEKTNNIVKKLTKLRKDLLPEPKKKKVSKK